MVKRAFILIVLLAGCKEDKVQTYRAPKNELPPEAVEPSRRMLTAILSQGDRLWFFKLDGPGERVEAERTPFIEFVKSVRFDKADPTWTLPAGWKQNPGSGMRFATIQIGDMEMTVVPLGQESAPLLPNINRWRSQMGLGPIDPSDVSKYVTTMGPITLVDLVSPEDSKPEPPKASKLAYDVPTGWKEIPAKGMRAAAFEIAEGALKAEMTVIPLSGSSGTLLENINRWRGQIGMEPIKEEQLEQTTKKIDVAGLPGTWVELNGPSVKLLGAIVPKAGQTWFFKLQGPAEMVDRHKAAFESFLRSVKFNG
jgi:hypothetical protein